MESNLDAIQSMNIHFELEHVKGTDLIFAARFDWPTAGMQNCFFVNSFNILTTEFALIFPLNMDVALKEDFLFYFKTTQLML